MLVDSLEYDLLDKIRNVLRGDEPAGRFPTYAVYQVQKLMSDKAQINFERNILHEH